MTDYKPSAEIEGEQGLGLEAKDYQVEDYLALGLFWLLAVTVFAQLFSRFLLSTPMGWTEEVARYQLVCLGYIGSCMAIRKNTHIYVVLFHRHLPEAVSLCLKQFIAFFNCGFIALMTIFAWQIMPKLHIHKMASLEVPISLLYGFIWGSLLIMLYRAFCFFIMAIKRPAQLLDTSEYE